MVYKDIEDRREAWRRWYHKQEKTTTVMQKRKARDIARWANPIIGTCSIEDCGMKGERHHIDYSKPKEIIWLCKRHHENQHHKNVCVLCADKHRARGYCNRHWKQWRKGLIK